MKFLKNKWLALLIACLFPPAGVFLLLRYSLFSFIVRAIIIAMLALLMISTKHTDFFVLTLCTAAIAVFLAKKEEKGQKNKETPSSSGSKAVSFENDYEAIAEIDRERNRKHKPRQKYDVSDNTDYFTHADMEDVEDPKTTTNSQSSPKVQATVHGRKDRDIQIAEELAAARAVFVRNHRFKNAYAKDILTRWSHEEHDEEEQRRRFWRGVREVGSPETINFKSRNARFIGSEGNRYKTSLHRCDCMDFSKRELPCKHMYRLANMLSDGEYRILVKKVLSGLNKKTKQYLFDFLYALKTQPDNFPGIFPRTAPFKRLAFLGVLQEHEGSYAETMQHFERRILAGTLTDAGLSDLFNKGAQKKTLVKIIENIESENPDLLNKHLMLLGLDDALEGYERRLYNHLYVEMYGSMWE